MSQLLEGPGDRLPQRRSEPPLQPTGQGRTAAPCPSCRRPGLHTLDFRLTNGDAAQMRRCTRCEWKGWWLGERQVALAQLLDAVHDTGLPRARRSAGRRRRAG